ncbi:Uncharacterised protein [Vibrio cholerae]|nr:Uncharacterised protein [Vibrio cholerae]
MASRPIRLRSKDATDRLLYPVTFEFAYRPSLAASFLSGAKSGKHHANLALVRALAVQAPQLHPRFLASRVCAGLARGHRGSIGTLAQ